MDTRQLDDDIAGCAAAHQRLLAELGAVDDALARRPSLLPGWTVGHVLSHLARNADSFSLVIENAAPGAPAVAQYPGGAAQRSADIEAGAGLPSAQLVDDMRRSIWRLEGAWAAATTAWEGFGANPAHEFPVHDVPHRRWREVEIHHADLGLGFTWRDWSDAFVRRELAVQTGVWASRRPMGDTALPAPALAVSPHERLAWLVGRVDIDGLEPAGIF